jgi:hypothetical protein
MDDQNQKAMDRLLMEIAEMIEMIQNHRGPLKPDVSLNEIKMNLNFIKKSIAVFQDVQNESIQTSQLDPDDVIKKKMKSPKTPPEEKQFHQKAREIALNAKALQLTYAKVIKEGKRKKRTKPDEKQAQQMRERRKLFKTIGGDKKWIPL